MTANLILITGDDEEQIRAKTAEAVKEAAGEEADEFSLDIIKETDDSTPLQLLNDVIQSIQTPSFFGKKTICLQNCSFFDSEGTKTDKSPLSRQFRTLGETITEGLPGDIIFILSGPNLDSRKLLYKGCQKAGADIFNFKKIQLMGNRWQEQVSGLIRKSAAEKDVSLDHRALEYLVQVIGTETGRIDQEIEKIACACNGKNPVTVNDIQDICTGNASTAFYAFSNALGDRDLRASTKAIDNILMQTKDPEQAVMGLLLQTSRHFRMMLKMKLFMQQTGLRDAGQVYNFLNRVSPQDKEKYKDSEFIKMHPFRAKNIALSASKYSGPELINAVKSFTETNRKLVMSPPSKRMLLEQLSFSVIKGTRTKIQG